MTSYNHNVAVQAAEENTALRTRLQRMEEERERAAEKEAGEKIDTTMVDELKSKNNAIQNEICELQRELRALKAVNVTELSHEYQRLEARRAYLHNENTGLRNVLNHQSKDVKKATRAVNEHQDMRRMNDDSNATAKSDIKMFKERRDRALKENSQLSNREAQLLAELGRANNNKNNSSDLEVEVQRLTKDNEEKDQQIQDLEDELGELQERVQQEKDEGDDIGQLREEYVLLKNKLKEKKNMSTSL